MRFEHNHPEHEPTSAKQFANAVGHVLEATRAPHIIAEDEKNVQHTGQEFVNAYGQVSELYTTREMEVDETGDTAGTTKLTIMTMLEVSHDNLTRIVDTATYFSLPSGEVRVGRGEALQSRPNIETSWFEQWLTASEERNELNAQQWEHYTQRDATELRNLANWLKR